MNYPDKLYSRMMLFYKVKIFHIKLVYPGVTLGGYNMNERMRENCTSGTAPVAPGNRRPYG
jgi:hypothetical protein